MRWGCQKFCCSQFYKYQDQPLTKPPDLTNPIHPIFRQDRFQDDVDYSLFEMSLRLASRFLILDNVARHIVVMTDGVKTTHHDPKGKKRAHIVRSAGPKKHPDDQSPDLPEDGDNYYHWRADEILQKAAEHIRFFVNDDNVKLVNGGDTRHREGPFTPAQTARLRVPGTGSNIHIGNILYRYLKAHADKINNGDVPNDKAKLSKLVNQFEFARSIVHELAHALENLYTGWRVIECFCEDNVLSERGFDMEAAIFGGLVDTGWSDKLMKDRQEEYCPIGRRINVLHPSIVLYKWPNRTYLEIYRQRTYKMGQMQDIPQFPKGDFAAERVPHHFAESLFLMAYWEEVRRLHRQSLSWCGIKDSWGVRWFRSDDFLKQGIHPWLTVEEAKSGVASNQPLQ